MEQTLAIIKPTAVRRKLVGNIISEIEQNDFHIKKITVTRLSPEKAAAFYSVHRTRPFFQELVSFMSSGPIFVILLEKDQAVDDWRDLMGLTDPFTASPGTIRYRFGQNTEENAVHGSDSPASAAREISFFFGEQK